jgi:capsular exopolysaccharide synthesis family protein
VECEAALASLQAVLDNGGDVAQCIGTISEVLGKEIIMENLGLGAQNANSRMSMEQELVKARSELQSFERNLGAQHPDVVALNGKIAMIENFLESSRLGSGNFQTDYLQNYFAPWLEKMLQSKLEEARKKEEIFGKRFETAREEAVNLNGQMVRVELLERDVKRLADMSDVLLSQLASINMKQNGQDVRVTVIEEPTVNAAPISPQMRFVLPFTLLGGAIASLIAVSIVDALNDRFRSMDELQTRLKVTVLGVIRHLKPPATKGLQSIAMHATPGAVECEGFRTLRTALGMTHQDARQILISSAESGDGKTTTLANLSVCYAQSDKRVLLIDADLRRMGLTQLLNMQGISGLSEVLRREEEIETLAPKHVRASGVRGLDVLPAGPRSSNPSEMLANPRFSQLLSWAGAKYDYVFIDCTPALITTDPAIIAQVVDGVVFVVQPAKNRRQLISHMVERFGLLNINVLGVIVNATGDEEETYAYNGLYGDYGHYGSYGVYGENETDEGEGKEDAGEEVLVPRTPSVVAAEDDDELVQPTIVPRRISKAG